MGNGTELRPMGQKGPTEIPKFQKTEKGRLGLGRWIGKASSKEGWKELGKKIFSREKPTADELFEKYQRLKTKKFRRPLKYLTKAAEKGSIPAMLEYFKTQKNRKKKIEQANLFLKEAIGKGSPEAKYLFYQSYKDDPHQKEQAFAYLCEAAGSGDTNARDEYVKVIRDAVRKDLDEKKYEGALGKCAEALLLLEERRDDLRDLKQNVVETYAKDTYGAYVLSGKKNMEVLRTAASLGHKEAREELSKILQTQLGEGGLSDENRKLIREIFSLTAAPPPKTVDLPIFEAGEKKEEILPKVPEGLETTTDYYEEYLKLKESRFKKEKALGALEMAAGAGNAEACKEYFRLFKDEDAAKALSFLKKAIDKNDREAMALFYNEYAVGKYPDEKALLLQVAEQGLPAACGHVALNFELQGALIEALKWWKQAAQKYREENKSSHSGAMCRAKIEDLEKRLDTQKTEMEAEGRKLCDQYKSMKLQGSKDAIDILCRAADCADPEALCLLGEGLEDGALVTVLKEKGENAQQLVYDHLHLEKGKEIEQLYERAKEGGFARAFFNLARLRERQVKAEETLSLYEEAGKRGISEAYMRLAAYYDEASKKEENLDIKERFVTSAIANYQKAAALEEPAACFKLAEWHETRSELDEASGMYQKALEFLQKQKAGVQVFGPNPAIVRERLAAIEKKKTALGYEKLLSTADEKMGQGAWKAALENYQTILQALQHPREGFLPTIEEKKEEIQGKERKAQIEVLLEDAKSAEASNWSDAARKYEDVLKQLTGPGNEERRRGVEKMRQEAQGRVYLENAKKLFEKGNWSQAIKEYENAVKMFPEMKIEELEKARCEELLQKGDAELDSENWEAAVQNFNAALNIYRDGVSQKKEEIEAKKNKAEYNRAKNRAEVHEKNKDWDSAIQEYEKILELPETAIQESKEKIEEKKKKAVAEKHDLQAKKYEDEGRFDAALEEYSKEMRIVEEGFAESGEVDKDWKAMISFKIEGVQKKELAKVTGSREAPLAVEPTSFKDCLKEAESFAAKEEWSKAFDMYEKAFELELKDAGKEEAKRDTLRERYSDTLLNLVASLEDKATKEEDWKLVERMYSRSLSWMQECHKKDPVRVQLMKDQNAEGYKKGAAWYEQQENYQGAATMYGDAIALIVDNRKKNLGWWDKRNLEAAQQKAKDLMAQADSASTEASWKKAMESYKDVLSVLDKIK